MQKTINDPNIFSLSLNTYSTKGIRITSTIAYKSLTLNAKVGILDKDRNIKTDKIYILINNTEYSFLVWKYFHFHNNKKQTTHLNIFQIANGLTVWLLDKYLYVSNFIEKDSIGIYCNIDNGFRGEKCIMKLIGIR